MKNLITIFFVMLFITGFSQETKTNRFDIGVNLFSVSNHISESKRHLYYSYAPRFSIFNGINFNFSFGKNAIRSGFYYVIKTHESSLPPINNGPEKMYNGEAKSIDIYLGYERVFGENKLQIVGGGDLGYSYGSNNGIVGSFLDCIECYTEYTQINSNFVYVSPFLGANYDLNSRFSIRIETSMNLGYSTLDWSTSDAFLNDKYDQNINQFLLIFNPIRKLSFNYHF